MSGRQVVVTGLLVLLGAVFLVSPQPLAAAEWVDNGMWSDRWRFPHNRVPVNQYRDHYTGFFHSVAVDAQGRPHIVFVNTAVTPDKIQYVRCSVTGETEEWHDIAEEDPLATGIGWYFWNGADAPTIAIDSDNRLHLAWWVPEWAYDADEEEYEYRLRLKYKYVNWLGGDAWDWPGSETRIVDDIDYDPYSDVVLTSAPVIALRPPSFDQSRVPDAPVTPLVHLVFAKYLKMSSTSPCPFCQAAGIWHKSWEVGSLPQENSMTLLFYPQGWGEPDDPVFEYRWLEMSVDVYNNPHLVWLEDYGCNNVDALLSLHYWSPTHGRREVTELDPANHSVHRLNYGNAPAISIACDAHNEAHIAWVAADPDPATAENEPFKCYYQRTIDAVWQPWEETLAGGFGRLGDPPGSPYPGWLAMPCLAATWRDDPTTAGDTVVDLHLTLWDGRYIVVDNPPFGSRYDPHVEGPVYLQRDGDPDTSEDERWSKTIRQHAMHTDQDPYSGTGLLRQVVACGNKGSMKVAVVLDDWDYDDFHNRWRRMEYCCFDASSAMSAPMPPWGLGSAWHLIGLPCVHEADYDPPPRRDPGDWDDRLVPAPLVFWQFNICGNLHRYDPAASSYVTYDCFQPSLFGHVGPGEGFWLSAFGSNRHRLTYEGVARTGVNGNVYWMYDDPFFPGYYPYQVPIWYIYHQPGWSWMLIGTPGLDPIPLDSLKVRNDATQQVKWWYKAAAAGWVGTKLSFYDPTTGSYAFCGPDPWDADNALRPWLGYWVHCDPEMDLTLYIPLHRDLFQS